MTQAFTIDGKAIAAKVRADVAKVVARIKAEQGITPGLAVVLVGEDPASKVYVRNKAAQTVEVGMESFEHKLSEELGDVRNNHVLHEDAAEQKNDGRDVDRAEIRHDVPNRP